MPLYVNHDSGVKIFQKSNEKMIESNQGSYHENFLQTVLEQQQSLNNQLKKNVSLTAEKSEMYNQALLGQISFQEKLLQDMLRKLQDYEQISSSIHEKVRDQEKLNDLIEKHHDLQNVYHQTIMNRFDNQEKELKEHVSKQGSSVTQHLDQHQAQLMETVEKQEKQFSDYTVEQGSQINDQLERQNTMFTNHLEKQQDQLKELFTNHDSPLLKRLDQSDAVNEKIDRKLDFIKSTIFERAADLSEKMDGHVKKLSDLFANMFSKQEPNQQVVLKEQEETTEKEDMNIQ